MPERRTWTIVLEDLEGGKVGVKVHPSPSQAEVAKHIVEAPKGGGLGNAFDYVNACIVTIQNRHKGISRAQEGKHTSNLILPVGLS